MITAHIPAKNKTFLFSSQLTSVHERLLMQKYRSSVLFPHLKMPFPPSKKSTPSSMQKSGQLALRHVLSVQPPRTNSVAPGFSSSSPVAWQIPLVKQA
jgi:hypothetical protein